MKLPFPKIEGVWLTFGVDTKNALTLSIHTTPKDTIYSYQVLTRLEPWSELNYNVWKMQRRTYGLKRAG